MRRKASQGDREGDVCPSLINILSNALGLEEEGEREGKGDVRDGTTSSAESYVDEV